MGIIRLILAFAVLLAHVDKPPALLSHFISGSLAVQCFYIISGFYMALVLNGKYTHKRDFYYNRFLRLYPTYWVVLAMTVGVALLAGRPTFATKILQDDALHWDGKTLMLVANLTMWGSDAMMFFFPGSNGLEFTSDYARHTPVLNGYHVVPQAWSLPVEMMFYAIAPFIVRSKLRLVILVLGSLMLRWWIYTTVSSNDPWSYRFFPTELAFFCLGSLAYFAFDWLRRDVYGPTPKVIGVCCTLVMVAFLATGSVLGPVSAYVLLLFSLPFVFIATRQSAVDRWIGELSYPVYVSHLLCLTVARNNLILGIGATLLVSVAINVVIQRYVDRSLKRAQETIPAYAVGALKI